MQATREPETAKELRRALAALGDLARRPNPPEEATPFVVSFRPVGPGQQWRELDRFAERAYAFDETQSPTVRDAADGTLIRLSGGGEPTWLGVMDGGRVYGVTGVPRDEPSGLDDWQEAWDGPRAEAGWMVEQCSHLPRQRVTLALAACAATGSALTAGILPKAARVLPSCLRTLRAWAAGRATDGDIEKALGAAKGYCDRVMVLDRPSAMPAYHVGSAFEAALWYAAWGTRPRDVPLSMVRAERAAFSLRSRGGTPSDWTVFDVRVQRKLAPRVRSFVSLGDVLLAERHRIRGRQR